MGMAVKGIKQHRLIAKAIGHLVSEWNRILTADELADCARLRQRADLAIQRLKKRKLARSARWEADA